MAIPRIPKWNNLKLLAKNNINASKITKEGFSKEGFKNTVKANRNEGKLIKEDLWINSKNLTEQEVERASSRVPLKSTMLDSDAYESSIRNNISENRIAQIKAYGKVEEEAVAAAAPVVKNTARTLESVTNKRIDANLQSDMTILNSGNPKSIENLTKKMGGSIPAGEQLNAGHIDDFYKNMDRTPSMGDKMTYHKVPQKAAAGLTTAFLISKMTGSKGELSNSELYGQQTPYQ